MRRHCNQHATGPRHFIVKLSPELTPPLIQDGTVQSGLLAHHLAGLYAIAFRRPGHLSHLQILNADERVVLADRRCGFMQVVFSGVRDFGVDVLDVGFCLFPVVAEFYFASHPALISSQSLLVLLEAVEWR